MKIINPKYLKNTDTPFSEWDGFLVGLNKVVETLPDIPELEFNREANDLVFLESQIMLFASVDREYSECAMWAKGLQSTMAYWKDLQESKFRDTTLQNIETYPNEKDRTAKIKTLVEDWSKRLRSAKLFVDVLAAKKRLLSRQMDRLQEIINLEKKIRY